MSAAPRRLLLVDDDPNLLDTGRDILEDAGYVVETAGTSASALDHLEKADFALMLVDFNLPDGSGVALAEKVRAVRPGVIVILMTGEAHVKLDPASNVSDILLKPVDPQQLLKILSKALP